MKLSSLLRSLSRMALLLTATGAIAASGPKLKIEHASGHTEVNTNPQKVLVMDVAALDMLDALGVKVTGVPSWKLPEHLKKYEAKEYLKLGSLFEPDYEAVNAAGADLIVVAGRMREKFPKLAPIAPTIDVTTDAQKFYASVERNARIFGELFGKQQEVEQRITKLRQSVANLRKIGEKSGTALIILTTGGKMSAFGAGSRFGAIYDEFGFKPADTSLKPGIHGQSVSYEYLLKTNPDWLFVIDRDMAIGSSKGKSAQQLLDNPLVAQTKAWKKKQVIYLNPTRQYVTGGSLRTEQEVVDEITAAMTSR